MCIMLSRLHPRQVWASWVFNRNNQVRTPRSLSDNTRDNSSISLNFIRCLGTVWHDQRVVSIVYTMVFVFMHKCFGIKRFIHVRFMLDTSQYKRRYLLGRPQPPNAVTNHLGRRNLRVEWRNVIEGPMIIFRIYSCIWVCWWKNTLHGEYCVFNGFHRAMFLPLNEVCTHFIIAGQFQHIQKNDSSSRMPRRPRSPLWQGDVFPYALPKWWRMIMNLGVALKQQFFKRLVKGHWTFFFLSSCLVGAVCQGSKRAEGGSSGCTCLYFNRALRFDIP